jgi:FAD/FMN-containing dehydrogenase
MATVVEERATTETTKAPLRPLSGWGGYPVVDGRELVSEDLESITRDVVLTRGLARSYGDASLPPRGGHTVAASRLADRVLSFDAESGLLRAEAGLSLYRLNRMLLDRGWFTPVTPGTQFVTLGGMVASDVHGKDQHDAGTFGHHVAALRMRLADGRIVEVTEASEPELFRATIGGMGLTGHILEVAFRMRRVASPWILAESEAVPDVEALVERLVDAGREWPYTVSWADCINKEGIGRGIVIKGRWAEASEAPARRLEWPRTVGVPVNFPDWALNNLSVRAFNTAYYHKHGNRTKRAVVHPHPFFYPLDAIHHWNRIYGKRGFTQYQCVVPHEAGIETMRRIFRTVAAAGTASFLCVVKDFRRDGAGLLSFPRPGVTFTFDIPVRERETQRLVDALNDLVASNGGRVYLAKDAFTRPEHFRAMEPRLDEFNAVRRWWDPGSELRSFQSIRLLGDDE